MVAAPEIEVTSSSDEPHTVRKVRRLAAVLVITVSVCSAAGAAVAHTIPVLAGNFSNSKGFGQSKPPEIYLGGDESGLVCHIRWDSWGGAFAVGTGTGWYVHAGQITANGHWAPAVVVLYHLGRWHGRPAYTKYQWYFPQGGSTYGASGRCSTT